MEYRNLNRVFTYNKALKLHFKQVGYGLKMSEVTVLLAVSQLSGVKGVALIPLFEHLKGFYRLLSYREIQNNCLKLSEYGLIEVRGRYPALYCITLSGRNYLTMLEKRCRETRWDK